MIFRNSNFHVPRTSRVKLMVLFNPRTCKLHCQLFYGYVPTKIYPGVDFFGPLYDKKKKVTTMLELSMVKYFSFQS